MLPLHARAAALLAARPGLPPTGSATRRRRGAVPDRRGAVGRRRRSPSATRWIATASATSPSGCPANVGQDLIEPVVDGVLHRALSKHTVREIFTDKRVEIQDDDRAGAARRCWRKDGIVVRSLFLGHVDLPAQYRAGLEGAAGRGAGDREDALHAAAQGEAGEGDSRSRRTPRRSSARRPPRPRRPRRSSPPRRARRR